jgi:hypothetical protein
VGLRMPGDQVKIPWSGFFSWCQACGHWEVGHHESCLGCGGPTRLFDYGLERTLSIGQLVWAEENVSKTARRILRWVPVKLSWVSATVVEGFTQDNRKARVKLVCPASSVKTEEPPRQPKEAKERKKKERKKQPGQRAWFEEEVPTMKTGDPT